MPPRTGRRTALVAVYPERDPAMPRFISNHGMRMVEATLRASRLDGLEVRAWDLTERDIDGLVAELLGYDPDVIGLSMYLWSFDFLLAVAARLKADDPARVVVLGGPSARPSMLGLPPFRSAWQRIDALAVGEGEETFVDVVALADRSPEGLASVAGLAVPAGDGTWRETATRPLGDLDQLPSPYVMELVPHGGLGVLQTYRGCPFTCSFCEWGVLESPKRVRASEGLVTEFDAMARTEVGGALLVDAGLNLNSRAFANLEASVERSGFLASRHLICEVYPARVRERHIEFLRGIGQALVGVGLQSFDNDVLAHVERSYDESRFDDNVHQLTEVAAVAVEIILGLPGDSPEQFHRTFERARRLPCAVRVYHCVVLPSALMVRAPAHYRMDYDPHSLKMRSCLGWTESALAHECDRLTRLAAREGGKSGQFFWIFPPAR